VPENVFLALELVQNALLQGSEARRLRIAAHFARG